MALLEITDLSTDIRLSSTTVHALDRVTLSVDAGETLGIVGESGSGKTMTAMSIERLLPPGGAIVGGSVVFDGLDLVRASEQELRRVRGRDIGMIFQDPVTSLNPVQSIGTQVAEPLLIHRGVGRAEAREQVVDMLRLVGLPSPEQRFDDYPHQMSGGQRQRVMIAMALICRPKLLIADEPTTALDVTVQKQILELVGGLREELGMAMILVTHDLGVIAGNADRVAVMYGGQVAEEASVGTLFDRPRHRYTEALFEALPERAVETGGRLYSIPGLPPDLASPPSGCRFAPRCRFATDTCRTEAPVLETVQAEDGAQRFACFHPRVQSIATITQLVDGAAPEAAVVPVERGPVDAAASREEPVSETGVPVDVTLEEAVSLDDRGWVAPTTPIPDDGVPIIEFRGLVKDFPTRSHGLIRRTTGAVSAVAHVDLSIARGTTVGLVGESGCGKTTLGRLAVGLDTPTAGQVLFRGTSVPRMRGKEARERRAGIQLMFQDSYASLDPRMRVRQILREPLEIQHVGTSRDRDGRVDELLDAVGLPRGAADRYPHEFSGGQRQRIGLARALALQPGLIVADEPVSALDVSIQAQILNLMKELQRERQLTYLFISHDLSVVRFLSDVIAVMYLGKIVEIGPAAEVVEAPQHPYTRGLLDAVPVPDPLIERRKARVGVQGELPSASNPPSGCRFRTRCPIAQDICAQLEPPLQIGGGTEATGHETGPGAHTVACHFPLSPDSAVHAEVAGTPADLPAA